MTRYRTLTAVILAVGSLLLGSSFAATPACGRLCATAWKLDVAASTDVADAIEDALDDYKEEKIKRRRTPSGSDYAAIAKAEMDESLGPLRQRPIREELREEVTRRLVIPETLKISQDEDELRIDEGRSTPRRFDLRESYSRVDSLGTAEIKARWTGGSFVVTEDYRKGRSNREAYAVDAKSGLLTVTRTLSRPALPKIVVQSLYRPVF